MNALKEFTSRIWVKEYPVRYSGCTFLGRMTVVHLSDGRVLIHSPCSIDEKTKAQIEKLGPVAFIVAPGNFHYLHVPSCQRAFPAAKTFICPGIESKRPSLHFDGVLGDTPASGWSDDLDQVLVRGCRFMWEVAFFHRSSRTLILVDLIENIGDATPGTNRFLRFFWKYVFRMWNVPKPAPEYQMGWKDKAAARKSLHRILDWQFDTVIIAHGEPLVENSREAVVEAWKRVLK